MNQTGQAKAAILPGNISRTFYFRGISVVDADLNYPQIRLHRAREIENRINTHYKFVAMNLLRYTATKLYSEAVAAYWQARKNGYPFRQFSSALGYTVGMNERCILSTCSDRYEYTGGAHGSTLRTSVTWNLSSGRIIRLPELMGVPYPKPLILEETLKAADRMYAENPGIYFENYRELIRKNLNLNQFYLTPEGVVIYFQQYEIAPYASGIPELLLTWEDLQIRPPGCE